jgi:hypothetical protein
MDKKTAYICTILLCVTLIVSVIMIAGMQLNTFVVNCFQGDNDKVECLIQGDLK